MTPSSVPLGLCSELVRRKILYRLECPPDLVNYNLAIHCVRHGRPTFRYGHELLADILGYRRTPDGKRKAIQRLIKNWFDYQRTSGYRLQEITRGGCQTKKLTTYGRDHIQPVVDWLSQQVTSDPSYGRELPEVAIDRYLTKAIGRLPRTARPLTLPIRKQLRLATARGEPLISRDRLTPLIPQSEMCLLALAHHRAGFNVFPVNSVKAGICTCKLGADCDKKGKHPRLTGWQSWAESARGGEIRELWRKYPTANVGIKTGGTLVVVDVDPKSGGGAEWNRLIAQYQIDVPETFRVKTGSGGFHLYFETPEPLRSKQLAPGIDFKAVGGFVVAPGSTHASGNKYEVEVDAAIAAIPRELLELAKVIGQREIPEGRRHAYLMSCARAMAGAGFTFEEINSELAGRRNSCATGNRAIMEGELDEMARWAADAENSKQSLAMKAAA